MFYPLRPGRPAGRPKKVSFATVKEGDLVISRSGTLGVALAIRKDLSKSVFGSYFIRVRPNIDIDREYLAFYLNSFLGKAQVEQISTGAIQTNLTIPVIKDMKVLIPKKDFQNEIASLVIERRVLRNKGLACLKQAKTKIEVEIEK